MKIIYIILLIVASLLLLSQIYVVMASRKTNHQPYQVVRKEKDFEIRFYPSVTIATVKSNSKSFDELGNRGFRQLAGYIFGGNGTGEKIAMTAPVVMDIQDSVSSMSFIMPEGYSLDKLPMPKDPGISLVNTADEYVAAISFGGFASDEDIEKQILKLKTLLDQQNISYHGSFRYLGYNPPYQLVDRKNEIVVTVDWK
ncbi:MAG: heme-binding protein [Chitinophagaceae bacterium]|nr:heme-binding protein [Chitinophagaceae bacterium]